MGFPRRPKLTPKQASSSDSTTAQSTLTESQRSTKRIKLSNESVFDSEQVKIFIVVAKLSPDEIKDATRTIESNGGKVVSNVQDCTIILSNTRLWNRLKKSLPSEGFVRTCILEARLDCTEPSAFRRKTSR